MYVYGRRGCERGPWRSRWGWWPWRRRSGDSPAWQSPSMFWIWIRHDWVRGSWLLSHTMTIALQHGLREGSADDGGLHACAHDQATGWASLVCCVGRNCWAPTATHSTTTTAGMATHIIFVEMHFSSRADDEEDANWAPFVLPMIFIFCFKSVY